MKRMKTFVVPVLLLLTATGCRKDLCYDHDEHSESVKVYVNAEWEQEWERSYDLNWPELWPEHWTYAYDDLRPRPAQGIRTIVYQANGNSSEHNLSSQGGRLPIPAGTHVVLFYNNDT